MRATDLEGIEWTVRRRWLPRYEGRGLRERLRQRRARAAARRQGDEGAARWFDVLDIPALDDSLTAVAVVVAAVLALVLLAVWGIPLLLALVDLVFVLLVAVLGLAGRVIFRRPWTVEATAPDGRRRELRVVGWRRAGEAVADLAGDISHGRLPAGPGPTAPA